MKRIIAVLFFIINTMIFFGMMSVYEKKDLTYIFQLDIDRPGIFHELISLDSTNNEVDSQSMFELFKELTNRYELLISVPLGDYPKNQFDYYMISNENMDQRLGLITDKSINLNETDDFFYTSKKDNPDGIYFYLLNTELDVNIYPITYLGEMPSSTISVVAASREELNEAIEILLGHFGDSFTRMGEPSAEPFIVANAINSFLPATILLLMICIFLLLMMYVYANSKKIAIFKTLGLSLSATALKMFSLLFVIIALVIVITNLFLYSIFVGAVNARTIPLIIDLIKSGLFQLAGVFLTIALSCLLLTFVPNYSLLKNNRLNKQLMRVNFVLKILILVTLLPIVSDKMNHIIQNVEIIRYATRHEADGFQFVPRYKMEYADDGYDYIVYMQEFYQSYDVDVVNRYELLNEYHEAYQILDEAGAIYCRSYKLMGDDSGIYVNENYIKKHPIRDIDGNWIDIEQIDTDVLYLIPKCYADKYTGEFYLSDPYENEDYEMIVIDNEQEIFNYNPEWKYDFLQRPHMITLYKDAAFRLNASIFNDVFIDSDISALLKNTRFYDKIVIKSLEDEFAFFGRWALKNVMDGLKYILPTFALTLVIIIQYAYLYLKECSGRIFIQKIFGYNPFRIYSGLLLESGFAVAVAAFISLYRKDDIRLFPLVMGMEILAYLLIIFFLRGMYSKFSNANES